MKNVHVSKPALKQRACKPLYIKYDKKCNSRYHKKDPETVTTLEDYLWNYKLLGTPTYYQPSVQTENKSCHHIEIIKIMFYVLDKERVIITVVDICNQKIANECQKAKIESPIFPEMNKNMYAIIYKNYYIYVSLIANLYHELFFSFWSILRSTLISQKQQ